MTQKDLLEKVLLELSKIRQEVPNPEADIQQLSETVKTLKEDVSQLKFTLLNPEEGVIVRVNKNTDFRIEQQSEESKQQQESRDIQDLLDWKSNVSKALWIVFTALVGIVVKLTFFDGQQ